ncbi:MAG: hypothetical protein ACTHN0_08630 [Aquihabitans sp.]
MIQNILREGRQAHVAIVSPRGPHVTPELYAWSGGRLWFWFARTTLKARVLSASPACAAMVAVGERAVLVQGTADLMDVGRPATLVGSPARGLRAGIAAASYVARNASDLVAFGRDLGTGRLGWRPPPRRVLASMEPEDVQLIAHVGPPAGSADDEPVVVALPGPAVVPGWWSASSGLLHIDPNLLDQAGVRRETALALVADEYVAPGPAAKVGTLLRGTGRRDGRSGRLAVVADTLTTWDGVETATHRRADQPTS